MLGIGVVGYGYWGPNLVRNLWDHPNVAVAAVCDTRTERLDRVRRRYPGVGTTTRYEDLLADARIDAVVICTPVHTHFDLAWQALRSGRHVLVEKPLASSTEQASRLVEEARRRNLCLAVDHTFVFTPAVRRIRELVTRGEMGRRIYYYDSVRVNLGLFENDVNVLWDLAVHDLSIMDYVLPGAPLAVSATGVAHVPNRPENLAYLTCFYPDDLIAHIHVNWLAPVKLRRTLIGGDQKMVVFNDLEPTEKLRIYNKGVQVDLNGGSQAARVDYRTGDVWIPKLPLVEALQTEVDEFVGMIERGVAFAADGEAGLRVVRVLEAATHSMQNRGVPVELDPVGVQA